jgi:hypothetical protein
MATDQELQVQQKREVAKKRARCRRGCSPWLTVLLASPTPQSAEERVEGAG